MVRHLAFVTNFIPPYRKPVLDLLHHRYEEFRVFISTPMEQNRRWVIRHEGLNVTLQKTFTLRGSWRHPSGFREPLAIHLPIDTVQQLRGFGADVVISAEMGFRTWFAVIYRKRFSRSRLIVWADVSEATEQGRGWLRGVTRRLLSQNVDAFFVNGESGARYLCKLNVDDRKIFRIPYATDIKSFGLGNINRPVENIRHMLYVGRLIEIKGLVPFCKALCEWATAHPESSLRWTVAGEGPIRGKLEELSTPSNLKIVFLGEIEYEKLYDIYSQADIFVMPSLAETWGLVINEAMSVGLPVLGSIFCQAVEELVKEGKNGWLFRPDSKSEIFNAIDRCMKEPVQKLKEMSDFARDIATKISPEYVVELISRAVTICTEGRPIG